MHLKSAPVLAQVVLFCFIFPQLSVAQEAAAKKPAKKVWSNDDLQRLTSADPSTTPESTSPESSESVDLPRNHYVRAKDPKWYVRQLGPLREEIEQIDRQLKAILQAHKDGRGTTGVLALDQEPDGVTTEAQIVLLQRQHGELLHEIIDDLESEARRNEVSPGALRSEVAPNELATATEGVEDAVGSDDSEIAEVENSLWEDKEQLKRARKELDLLQRGLDLEQRQVYSNPDYLSRGTGDSTLTSIQSQISGKQQEIQQAEQEIAGLEEHLVDLKLNRTPDVGSRKNGAEGPPGSPGARGEAKEEKSESYWRKRFADIRYEIGIAETERDILQRELNVLLLEYDPNPAKALRENVTRKEINEHQKAIEDKQQEIGDLRQALSDLEDQVRRAGGYPGWSRE